MLRAFAFAFVSLLFSITATADPIFTVTSTSSTSDTSIDLASTTLTITVDPNDVTLSAITFNFSALMTDITIVRSVAVDPETTGTDPAIDNGTTWFVSLQSMFGSDKSNPPDTAIVIGTIEVIGLTPGGSLMLSGTYTTGSPDFTDIPINLVPIATVIPEPDSLGLVLLGLVGWAVARRRGRP